MDDVLTYADIASDWNLWAEYVDPSATMTEAEFDALPIEEKIAIQTECFGEESFTVTCKDCRAQTLVPVDELYEIIDPPFGDISPLGVCSEPSSPNPKCRLVFGEDHDCHGGYCNWDIELAG